MQILSSSMFTRRSMVVVLAVVLGLGSLLLASPVAAQLGMSDWIQLGSDVDGEASNDLSGDAVAMSTDGTTVVVGAARNDGSGTNAGNARVFRWDGNSWGQLGSDIDGESATDQSGFAVAISATGDTVAIGAPQNDGGGANSGHVRVYRYDGVEWNQMGSDIDGEAANDRSGEAVAISAAGDTVIIGATENAGNGQLAGHARVFGFVVGEWVQLGDDIDGEDEFDTSGRSVAISAAGDMIAVGADRNGEFIGGAGHIRVFRSVADSWVQVGTDIDGQASIERVGRAIAMSADGNTLVAGVPGYLNNISFKGGARIYQWDGTTWGQRGSVIPGRKPFDLAGSTVDISSDGDTIVFGARDNGDAGRFAGHARIFGWNGSDWAQLGEDIGGEAPNDFFGAAVSISGDGETVAVGAAHNDDAGANAGHVRMFRDTTQPAVSFCNGLEVTVNLALGETPTVGDDVIRGTTGPDTINGLGGNDTICALQGDDTINGGDGFDRVFGGAGHDVVIGGAGNDTLIGGLGADSIAGGNGNDRIQGGDGSDIIDGDGGYDIVSGGGGDDTIRGGTHDDLLFGNLGRDNVFGDGGNDTLRGGAWLDSMDGGSGDDGCTLTDPSGNVEVRISCESGVFGR